ncbi:MAG: helix-hairpin-helix domain-containing protein [Bacteroidetes bacterium]|nr:helix-hairpin-helix domain-containing protein [Bacteroidota bacterium]
MEELKMEVEGFRSVHLKPGKRKEVIIQPTQESGLDRKCILLFIICICIISFHYGSELRNRSKKISFTQHSYLNWTGQFLEILETPPENHQELPVHIIPIFFQPIPINEASPELLITIPGIGRNLASEIIKTRSLHGHFSKPEDLLVVKGIGKKRMKTFSQQFSF